MNCLFSACVTGRAIPPMTQSCNQVMSLSNLSFWLESLSPRFWWHPHGSMYFVPRQGRNWKAGLRWKTPWLLLSTTSQTYRILIHNSSVIPDFKMIRMLRIYIFCFWPWAPSIKCCFPRNIKFCVGNGQKCVH